MDNILILVNHFNNEEEVRNYVQEIKNVTENSPNSVNLVVCDNSDNISNNFCENDDFVSVVKPGKNLGYIGGCSFGFEGWCSERSRYPEWVAISNTDLHLPRELFSILKGKNGRVGAVAPMIKTGDGRCQNPHLLCRPSRKRIIFYLFIHYNKYIGAAYIKFSSLIKGIFSKQRSNYSCLANDSINVYAPHGSLFFLAKVFFEKGGKISGFKFLFSEEWYIAEQLHQLGMDCIIDRGQIVIHDEHSVTGLLKLVERSKQTYISNREIFTRYY